MQDKASLKASEAAKALEFSRRGRPPSTLTPATRAGAFHQGSRSCCDEDAEGRLKQSCLSSAGSRIRPHTSNRLQSKSVASHAPVKVMIHEPWVIRVMSVSMPLTWFLALCWLAAFLCERMLMLQACRRRRTLQQLAFACF